MILHDPSFVVSLVDLMEENENNIKLEKTSQQQKNIKEKIGQDDLPGIVQIYSICLSWMKFQSICAPPRHIKNIQSNHTSRHARTYFVYKSMTEK
jgi:hypothetical protein